MNVIILVRVKLVKLLCIPETITSIKLQITLKIAQRQKMRSTLKIAQTDKKLGATPKIPVIDGTKQRKSWVLYFTNAVK